MSNTRDSPEKKEIESLLLEREQLRNYCRMLQVRYCAQKNNTYYRLHLYNKLVSILDNAFEKFMFIILIG